MGEFLNISNEGGGYNLGASASDSIQVITKSYYDREMLLTSTTEFQQNTSTGKTVDSLVAKDLIKNVEDTKSELLSDQQLVYRQTANGALTWEPSALMLNSIKGKTLVLNQVVSGVANGGAVITAGLTLSMDSNGIITINGTATSSYFNPFVTLYGEGGAALSGCPAGKYYQKVEILNNPDNLNLKVYALNSRINFSGSGIDFTKTNSLIGTCTDTSAGGSYGLANYGGTGTVFNNVKIRVSLINLTLMFGAGNEPSTAEEFEALYHNTYYAYNPGALISNDAEAFETVGFNLWDEETEDGRFDTTTGKNVSTNDQIRSKNYIPIIPGEPYCIHTPVVSTSQTYNYPWVLFFDANKNAIAAPGISGTVSGNSVQIQRDTVFSVPSNACYMRFYMQITYGQTYNHDICLNLSDPAKNGTYEPYRKSTLHLGLNAIKVNSQNIWDEEWEVGAISSSTGMDAPSSNDIRSKNYIKVIPGASYYCKCPQTSLNARYYDANKNFLAAFNTTIVNAFTVPSDAHYLRFWGVGTTYNNDICINISSSFNGQYEPHGVLTITGGLKSAGSVYDEIVGNKYIKRIGEVDLGTLSWSTPWWNADGRIYVMVANKKKGITNIVYPLGPTYAGGDNNLKNTIGICGNSANNYIYIGDAKTHSSASEFITSLSGVYAYYELATPIEYELASPIVYATSCGTIESRISPDALGLSAPFRADIRYGMRQGDVVETANAFSRWYTSQGIGGDNVVTSQLGGLKIMVVDDESQIGEDANTIYILKG